MFRVCFVCLRSVSVCLGLFCLFGVCLGLFRTCVRPECATAFPPTAAGEGFGAGAPETFTRSRGATFVLGPFRICLGLTFRFVSLRFVWVFSVCLEFV